MGRALYRTALSAVLLCGVVGSQQEAKAEGAKAARKLPPLTVQIDKRKVDIDKRRVRVRMSRKASHVDIKVFADSGEVIAEETHDFKGRRAGSWLPLPWTPSNKDTVAKIEIFATDAHGYYAGVRIVPWSLWIPHEEVNFATNSAKIRKSQTPQLRDSLEKILEAIGTHKDLGTIKLYVGGHTDTVGMNHSNVELSRQRARSIARWFRSHGLKLAISYEGFGEASLLVKTKDEVAEPKNRRVDYVLSVEDPRFKNSKRRPYWKSL